MLSLMGLIFNAVDYSTVIAVAPSIAGSTFSIFGFEVTLFLKSYPY